MGHRGKKRPCMPHNLKGRVSTGSIPVHREDVMEGKRLCFRVKEISKSQFFSVS